MASPLGDISLRIFGKQDVFYQSTVEEAAFDEAEELNNLTDPDYLNGFQAGTLKDLALESTEPDQEFDLIEVPEGFQYVEVNYRDGGYSDKNYDLLIILLLEEEPEPVE